MTEIRLGTNRFVDCDRVIEIDGLPLFTLTIGADGGLALSVELSSPPALQEIKIEDNRIVSGPAQLDVVDGRVRLSMGGHRLLEAKSSLDSVEVALDLRPLGLGIYSDTTALHIGASIFSENTFRVKTGIRLTTRS